MKAGRITKIIAVLLFLIPLLTYQGCKKQPKCGCGKDMLWEITDAQAVVVANESTNMITFYPVMSSGSTYFFCNPGTWMDSVKAMGTQEYLLISGKVYYDCSYVYQSSNSYYQIPPVYQVEVTGLKEDNYGKK